MSAFGGRPRKPDTVLHDLHAELRRARGRGLGFDDAWGPAMEVALRSASRPTRLDWMSALSATRDAWRAGYERRPPTAIASAAEMLATAA